MLKNYIRSHPLNRIHKFIKKTHRIASTSNSFHYSNSTRFSATETAYKKPASLIETKLEVPAPHGLFRLLNDTQRKLWQDQVQLSQRAKEVLSQLPTLSKHDDKSNKDIDTLKIVKESSFLENLGVPGLESTFSVVVAGEFNAGKSTVINALLGEEIVESGALPTTDTITILTNQKSHQALPPGISLSSESSSSLLRDVTLIDTPGTNTCLLDHTSRTLRLLPSTDLILFVTSVERPLSQSEQTLLKSIQAYQKSIVIVLNKLDVLESLGTNYGEDQKLKVQQFVKDQLRPLFGAMDPLLFSVSARDALHVKKLETSNTKNTPYKRNNAMWERSKFEYLEHYLKHTLTQKSKIQTKLMNPIGVIEGQITQAQSILQTNQKHLETDVSTLHLVLSQLKGWKQDVKVSLQEDCSRDFTFLFLDRQTRHVDTFFEELTFWKWIMTLNKDIFWHDWMNAAQMERLDHLDSNLQEILTEWAEVIASKTTTQSQATLQYLGKRPSMMHNNLIGTVHAGNVKYNQIRQNILDKLQKSIFATSGARDVDSMSLPSSSKRQFLHFDSNKEATDLYQSLQTTRVFCVISGLSGLTLGALSYLEHIDLALGGSSSAALFLAPFIMISYQSKHLRTQYQQKITFVNDAIQDAIQKLITNELDKLHKQMVEGMDPYKRFVETEQTRVEELLQECDDILADAFSLRNRIQKMGYNDTDVDDKEEGKNERKSQKSTNEAN